MTCGAIIFKGILLSFVPLVTWLTNNLMLGAVVVVMGPSMIGDLAPHGVFEIPALFIATRYGVWQGLWPFAKGKGRLKVLLERSYRSLLILIFVITPLLFIAAIIEGISINQRDTKSAVRAYAENVD